ncbi:MAG: DNA-binding protein [Prevotella sp.]|nr:DNA-binding protein [Prevotella sp.]MBO5467990.1 DNA-binding protein [Prevotella sp.]
MIRYKLYKNNNQKSTMYGKWYARTVTDEMLNTAELAEHMANHNSPYSEGIIKGVLTDMIKCIKELVLDGKSVKLDDLAIFSCGMRTRGADSASEFTVGENVKSVHLRARATGRLSYSSINAAAQIKEQTVYNVDKSADE